MTDYTVKARMNRVHRYMVKFATILRHTLLPMLHPETPFDVFVPFHFAERMCDRSVEENVITNMVSYALEAAPSTFARDGAVAIVYKDVTVIITCGTFKGTRQIRFNTVLVDCAAFTSTPIATINIPVKEFVTFVPINLRVK